MHAQSLILHDSISILLECNAKIRRLQNSGDALSADKTQQLCNNLTDQLTKLPKLQNGLEKFKHGLGDTEYIDILYALIDLTYLATNKLISIKSHACHLALREAAKEFESIRIETSPSNANKLPSNLAIEKLSGLETALRERSAECFTMAHVIFFADEALRQTPLANDITAQYAPIIKLAQSLVENAFKSETKASHKKMALICAQLQAEKDPLFKEFSAVTFAVERLLASHADHEATRKQGKVSAILSVHISIKFQQFVRELAIDHQHLAEKLKTKIPITAPQNARVYLSAISTLESQSQAENSFSNHFETHIDLSHWEKELRLDKAGKNQLEKLTGDIFKGFLEARQAAFCAEFGIDLPEKLSAEAEAEAMASRLIAAEAAESAQKTPGPSRKKKTKAKGPKSNRVGSQGSSAPSHAISAPKQLEAVINAPPPPTDRDIACANQYAALARAELASTQQYSGSAGKIRFLFAYALQVLDSCDQSVRSRFHSLESAFESLEPEEKTAARASIFNESSSRLSADSKRLRETADTIELESRRVYFSYLIKTLNETLEPDVLLCLKREVPNTSLSAKTLTVRKKCSGPTVPFDFSGALKEDYLDVYALTLASSGKSEWEGEFHVHYDSNKPSGRAVEAHLQRDGINGRSIVGPDYIAYLLGVFCSSP